ncbi:uncharacterized protein K460DRAFT_371314, partial [Cucurbitaria berberidis CBS 394.84]
MQLPDVGEMMEEALHLFASGPEEDESTPSTTTLTMSKITTIWSSAPSEHLIEKQSAPCTTSLTISEVTGISTLAQGQCLDNALHAHQVPKHAPDHTIAEALPDEETKTDDILPTLEPFQQTSEQTESVACEQRAFRTLPDQLEADRGARFNMTAEPQAPQRMDSETCHISGDTKEQEASAAQSESMGVPEDQDLDHPSSAQQISDRNEENRLQPSLPQYSGSTQEHHVASTESSIEGLSDTDRQEITGSQESPANVHGTLSPTQHPPSMDRDAPGSEPGTFARPIVIDEDEPLQDADKDVAMADHTPGSNTEHGDLRWPKRTSRQRTETNMVSWASIKQRNVEKWEKYWKPVQVQWKELMELPTMNAVKGAQRFDGRMQLAEDWLLQDCLSHEDVVELRQSYLRISGKLHEVVTSSNERKLVIKLGKSMLRFRNISRQLTGTEVEPEEDGSDEDYAAAM